MRRALYTIYGTFKNGEYYVATANSSAHFMRVWEKIASDEELRLPHLVEDRHSNDMIKDGKATNLAPLWMKNYLAGMV